MTTATPDSIFNAFVRASRRLRKDRNMIASESSAGFVIPKGQKRGERKGVQVFVKICRYSEALLKRRPRTGGLLCED